MERSIVMSDVDGFNSSLVAPWKAICDALQTQFDQRLGLGNGRLYHGSPVWFVNENPLVGYSLKKAGVAILFWSGQSFREPGLTAIGKHKAAELILREGDTLPVAKLDAWLEESKNIIWDYKNIAKRGGTLELLKGE